MKDVDYTYLGTFISNAGGVVVEASNTPDLKDVGSSSTLVTINRNDKNGAFFV